MSSDKGKSIDGFKEVLEMLQVMGDAERTQLLENLKAKDPKLANRLSEQLFSFGDLIFLEDTSLRTIVAQTQLQTWAIALRNQEDNFKTRIFSCLSRRGAQELEETVASQPPQRLSQVKEAQKQIVDLAKSLEKEGKVSLRKVESNESGKSGDEDPLV